MCLLLGMCYSTSQFNNSQSNTQGITYPDHDTILQSEHRVHLYQLSCFLELSDFAQVLLLDEPHCKGKL